MSLPAKLTVASTFGIHPPLGGGQLRVQHLCRRLAARFPVEVVGLVSAGEAAGERELSPGLREVRVPKSLEHARAEAELERDAGVPVTDVAFPELHELTPAFARAVATSAAPDGALMASHPYTLPVLATTDRCSRIWYDVHNVEADLKAVVLPQTDVGFRLLDATREVESACCERAELALAASAQDAVRLRELYGVPEHKLIAVPNGVDVAAIPFTHPDARRDLRSRLRMDQPLALFVGSWHAPNLAAVRRILGLASALPDVRFAVAGSVCASFQDLETPTNMQLLGVVEDELKATLLQVASVALNPMTDGSGTNMKMLDYLAAGVPVLSTTVGARGLRLDPELHVRIAALRDFPAAIRALLDEPLAEARRRALSGRAYVEEHFDWGAVAGGLLAELARRELH